MSLTSQEEMEELFSISGVDNHTEDLNAPEYHIQKCIDVASERVLMHLRSQYSEEQLETHPVIREIATYIALYTLSVRRGQPSLYSTQYEQAMTDLALMKEGLFLLGIPSRVNVAVQTPNTDQRFFYPVRVDDKTSTHVTPNQRRLERPRTGQIYGD